MCYAHVFPCILVSLIVGENVYTCTCMQMCVCSSMWGVMLSIYMCLSYCVDDQKTPQQKSRADTLMQDHLTIIDERDKLERRKMSICSRRSVVTDSQFHDTLILLM